jgi:hypothetical protein
MNNLPQELVDRISSYLSREDLKNTLLLSLKFQHAAEQYSGSFSKFALTEDNADQFLIMYSGRHLRHLRDLEFRTELPALEWDEEANKDDHPLFRDTSEDLDQMDQEFTRQIGLLFATLQKMETRAATNYGPGRIKLTLYTPTRDVDRNWYSLHRSFTSWRIHLLSPETLPSLKCIRSINVEIGADIQICGEPDPPLRKLDLRVLLDLSNKLPNLDSLQCKIGGDEWHSGVETEAARYVTQDWEGPRRDSRHDFGKALGVVSLPCLRHVRLDFIYPICKSDWIDQRLAMPNLVRPEIYDPFSTSLRLLSYQLRTMSIRVVADETLFWPADNSTPSWPNLKSINVMFHMATPSGTWYFQGLPNVGATSGSDVNEDSYPPLIDNEKERKTAEEVEYLDWGDNRVTAQFRVDPNNETLVPFLTAFAKATASMPSLKEFALWSPLLFCVDDLDMYEDFDASAVSRFTEGELAWGIAYAKPGAEAFATDPGEDFCSIRQIWWRVAKWRPNPELHNLFQQIGCEAHGKDIQEYWDDNGYSGEGLVERDWFESFEGRLFDH